MSERVKPNDGEEGPKERKLSPEEAIEVMPKTPSGVKITFKRQPKKDKIKKILGDKLKGITVAGDEITLILKADDLSSSDHEKIQKIVDGE